MSCSYEGWHGVFYMFIISLFLSQFITFFLPFFHFFLYTIFPLCHLSPLSVPCNATDGLCERWGRSQRISIYLTPVCPSSSSHSLIYHTQVLFYCCLAAGFQPMALLVSLSPCHHYCEPLLGISQHICISSALSFLSLSVKPYSTSKPVFFQIS